MFKDFSDISAHAMEFANWMTDARIEEFYRVELGYEYWLKNVWPKIGEGAPENCIGYEDWKEMREERQGFLKELKEKS